MTKLSTTLIQSGATLAIGAAIVVAPMLAFAHGNTDNSGQGDGSTRTVAISDSGSALVRGAKVTSISNGVITATTVWNNLSITWYIDTGNTTDLVRLNGAHADLSSVKIGDYVSVSGALDTTQSSFTIKADTVRDWSLTDPADSVAKRPASISLWEQMKAHLPALNFFANAGDRAEQSTDR